MLKHTFLRLVNGLGLFALSRWLTRSKLRILCYHGIWLGEGGHYGDCLFMSARRFRQRMEWVSKSPYAVLPLDEALRRLDEGSLPGNALAITIDDGWYSTYREMVPVLAQFSLPATLYVTTYYVLKRQPVLNVLLGYVVNKASESALRDHEVLRPMSSSPLQSPDLSIERDFILDRLVEQMEALPDIQSRREFVEDVAKSMVVAVDHLIRERAFEIMSAEELRSVRDSGVDIQLHTHTHRMHDFRPPDVLGEIVRNRDHLARILGVDSTELRHFCFPSGEYSESLYETLNQASVVSATTCEYGLVDRRTARLGLPRILDCESMSLLQLEAHLSGFWYLASKLRCLLPR